MNLTLIAPPAAEPITLAEVYRQLRLDPAGSPPEHPDDALLRGYITSARQEVEALTGRAFVEQTLRLSMAQWPGPCRTSALRLLRPPLIRVESVTWFDGENIEQTLDPADYYVTDDMVPELRFVTGWGAPSAYARPDAVRVTYVAGYRGEGSPPSTQEELAAHVPQQVKDAIAIGVQLLYDTLSDSNRAALERARLSLLRPPITILHV